MCMLNAICSEKAAATLHTFGVYETADMTNTDGINGLASRVCGMNDFI